MMTPAGVWEKWILMVKRLVSISVPIVHHVTIPCSESLLVSSSEGTVALKVPGFVAVGTLLLLLRVVLDLPTCLGSFDVLLPECVSLNLKMGDYLPNGFLFSSSPWHMGLHLFCHPLVCIGIYKCLPPLHHFDALKGFLGVEAGNLLGCEHFVLFPTAVGMKGS